ncbi:MAG: serine hydrolase domain-containing protein [Vicinamibacterales bacterium]
MTSRREFLRGSVAATASATLMPASVVMAAAESRTAINPPPDWFLARLPQLMDVAGTPGIAAVVMRGGRIVWEHHAGVLKAGEAVPVTSETLWPAASLGKPVFAAAVLGLVSERQLDLDRPLREYVPDHAASDDRTRRVTGRHVLSHTAGFPNWRNRPGQELTATFEPGSAFSYSGEGYYYLQRAVEHVTGLGIQQVVRSRVFDRLKMSSSTYAWRDDVPARLAVGHDRGVPGPYGQYDLRPQLWSYATAHGRSLDSFRFEDVRAAMADIPNAPAPLPNMMAPNVAGSLLTTARDYASFVMAVLDASGAALGLSRAERTVMSTSQVVLNRAMGWGLGLGIETPAGTLWHWGDNGGWKNFVLIEPSDGSALLVFTNGSHGMNVAERFVAAATGRDHAAFQWL